MIFFRFHSPAEWKPKQRRHFAGQLLSVNPNIAKWLPGLFCLNERAVYLGEWQYGFFSYSAIGMFSNVFTYLLFCVEIFMDNEVSREVLKFYNVQPFIVNETFTKGWG